MQSSNAIVCGLRFLLSVSSITLIPFIYGCGGGSNPVQVSGTVSYKGKPVPFGHISFIPSTSSDGKQVRITSTIKDGSYSLPSGKSVGGGEEYRVEIGGFSQAPKEEDDGAAPLFQLWSQTVAVPQQGGTLDFEVK